MFRTQTFSGHIMAASDLIKKVMEVSLNGKRWRKLEYVWNAAWIFEIFIPIFLSFSGIG